MMERLELVLLVPDEHEHDEWEGTTSRSDYRPRYTDREQLFPVRQIKEIGFYHLKQLKVVIKYSDHIDAGAKTTKQAEDRLDEWVDSEMVDISASGLNGKVTVIYELCMDRNLAFSLNTSYKERPLPHTLSKDFFHFQHAAQGPTSSGGCC
ncbi:hypothetical protein B0A54_09103 [Friedmanniomyces endolithicus]|uniref:Uncharacterized protein n=1 Tax=Friedmanniomyces endolithicus TaxID=329885 RepID=A0A4U0UY34_9PEZI|nr:hypothetical protein B0A54_09103 [Friedmanniomyces endolithicus]